MSGKLLFCCGRTMVCRTTGFLPCIHGRAGRGLSGQSTRFSNETQSENTSNSFQFSRSTGHPDKYDLNENLYPDFYKTPSKAKVLLGRVLVTVLPIAIGVGFYKAFTADYDLEVEEKLIENLPGYEEAMKTDANYVKALELQKQKRQESSS